MTAVLKPHKVEISAWPAGGYQVSCAGCSMSKVRNNPAGAQIVADRHSKLNAQQFRGYSEPGRGAEGESSN